ncbi:MAG: hypothetical protein LBF75_11760 [Treponema sp.]|jgi:hypothetical protein|nr:hypothetical protein [Treponema sp.]
MVCPRGFTPGGILGLVGGLVKKHAGILLLACFCCFTGTRLEAQWRQPFPSLRVIKTERFDLIYPPASEKTAQTLGGFADQVYDQVSSMLHIRVRERIPVVITPHTDSFNGYMNPLPYPHILLLDTFMSLEDMGTYTNALKGLFLHELTHAISLSSRSRAAEQLHKIFGGWVFPTIITAHRFMVEGVTVSFESLDGTGRVKDPLFKAGLLQAIHENAFLTPVQASELYDLPHIASGSYHYGGFFSAYLQEQYGMKKYVELWAAMGSGKIRLSFKVYNAGYYNLFQEVYGRPFPEVWNEFKESLRISGVEENPEPPVFNGTFHRKALLAAVDSGGGKVFAIDSISGKVIAYDPLSGKARNVTNVDWQAYDLAVSPDGGRFLVSAYRDTGSLNAAVKEYQAVVTEYDVRRGGKTGRKWKGLHKGRYFRDGVIGLTSDRHNSVMVYRFAGDRPKKEEEEVLLRGTEELLFSNPAPLNDIWIAFTAAKRGIRELCLYNYETREVYTVVSDAEDDENRWKYMRGLGVYEGRMLFSYDHDGRMYKLGMADPSRFLSGNAETLEVVFSERDFSGGVFQPVMADGGIYYRGAFASHDALMKFPEAGDSLSGLCASLTLRPWDEEERRQAVLPPTALSGPNPDALPSSRYWGMKYLNPLKLWLPYPLIRGDPNGGMGITINGPGFFSIMQDPTDTNRITLMAAMDIPYLMGDINLNWLNHSLGFPLTFTFSDTLDTTRSRYTEALRETTLGVTASFSRGLGSDRLIFSCSPQFQTLFSAFEPPDHQVWTDGPKSAYTWGHEDPYYIGGIGMGLSNLVKRDWELFGQGGFLAAYGKYALHHGVPVPDHALPRVEGIVQAAFEPYLPLRFRLYGVWDERGMNLAGQSTPFSSTAFSTFASVEYVNAGDRRMTDIPWLAGGEAEVKLFKVEVQHHLSHAYFNRFFGSLAYRGVVYDDQGHPAAEGTVLAGSYRLAHSLALRLGGIVSFALLPYMPFELSASFVGVWKMSNGNKGNPQNDFWIGPEINISL